jgi:hydroxymethylpyrimidine/phosphomethylpyrimidine kinase
MEGLVAKHVHQLVLEAYKFVEEAMAEVGTLGHGSLPVRHSAMAAKYRR